METTTLARARARRGLHEAMAVCRYCSLGLRAEADRAATARAHRDDVEVEAARRTGRALLTRANRAAEQAGAVDDPVIVAYLATCRAEWSRLDGRSSYSEWADVSAMWGALSEETHATYAARQAAAADRAPPRTDRG